MFSFFVVYARHMAKRALLIERHPTEGDVVRIDTTSLSKTQISAKGRVKPLKETNCQYFNGYCAPHNLKSHSDDYTRLNDSTLTYPPFRSDEEFTVKPGMPIMKLPYAYSRLIVPKNSQGTSHFVGTTGYNGYSIREALRFTFGGIAAGVIDGKKKTLQEISILRGGNTEVTNGPNHVRVGEAIAFRPPNVVYARQNELLPAIQHNQLPPRLFPPEPYVPRTGSYLSMLMHIKDAYPDADEVKSVIIGFGLKYAERMSLSSHQLFFAFTRQKWSEYSGQLPPLDDLDMQRLVRNYDRDNEARPLGYYGFLLLKLQYKSGRPGEDPDQLPQFAEDEVLDEYKAERKEEELYRNLRNLRNGYDNLLDLLPTDRFNAIQAAVDIRTALDTDEMKGALTEVATQLGPRELIRTRKVTIARLNLEMFFASVALAIENFHRGQIAGISLSNSGPGQQMHIHII